MTSSISAAPANAGFSAEALIDAHPQAELIRRLQRSAYRAYSGRHKLGLDALSWLAGPLAPMGFAAVDHHRAEAHEDCLYAVQSLVEAFTGSVADRRIAALLLADYPGRHPAVAGQLQRCLQSGATGIS